MKSGFIAGSILETGVPGRTKYPVASSSSMSWSAEILMLEALEIVLAYGNVR